MTFETPAVYEFMAQENDRLHRELGVAVAEIERLQGLIKKVKSLPPVPYEGTWIYWKIQDVMDVLTEGDEE